MSRKIAPIHPGEILLEDWMEPLGLTANRLAIDIHVPATRIGEIVKCKRAITAETALRLARYFDTSPLFWLNLQAQYDIDVASDSQGAKVQREVHRRVSRPGAP